MSLISPSEGRGIDAAALERAAAAPEPDRRARPKLAPLTGLRRYVLRYRWKVVGALAALLVAALATLTMPLAVRRMIDYGFSAERTGLIDQYFAALIAIAAVLAASRAGRYLLVTIFGARVVSD